MHDVTNLRELVIGYEEPRKHGIIQTTAEDLSIGLGKYLARSQWWSTSRETQAAASVARGSQSPGFNIGNFLLTIIPVIGTTDGLGCRNRFQGPGQLSFQLRHHPSIAITSLNLQLTKLVIEFTDHRQIFISDSMAANLAELLTYRGNLTTLNLRQPKIFNSPTGYPSLGGFRAPPLPRLEKLSLKSFRVVKDALLSLLENIQCLRRVCMGVLTLMDGEWLEVAGLAALDMEEVKVSVMGLGYGRAGDIWMKMKLEDEMAWGRERVGDEGLM
ncbi:MAG: hypothetical protein L6R38_007894 [Xanthoria sp. 2 TBL-2021]|nr:MAG: hypothetical protein L6R38_007894 [Xanthoria sp. 2 TBL-2021]